MHMHTCDFCKVEYKAKRSSSKFCGKSCAAKGRHETGAYKNAHLLRRTGLDKPCINCGKFTYAKNHELKRKKYCSQTCKSEYELKDKNLSKNCAICGQEFKVGKFRYAIAKYCSRKCYYKAMKHVGSCIVKCVVCGKEHNRPPSHLKYRPTCSMKCRGIADRSDKPIGKDYSSVRQWLVRHELVKECARCGYKEYPEILVVHHKDRDRTNNQLDNFEILCPNCHSLEHYVENKLGWEHVSTKRKTGKKA